MSKTTNRFSTDVRARAVRMGGDFVGRRQDRKCAATLLEWVKKSEVDSGKQTGVPTGMAKNMKD